MSGQKPLNDNDEPLETWDWKKNDPDFYEKASKLPEFKDEHYQQMLKRSRYMQAGKKYRIDMRPRTVFRKMRIEIFLLGFGLTCAAMLPFYLKSISRKRHQNNQERMQELDMQHNQMMGQASPYQQRGMYQQFRNQNPDNVRFCVVI